MGRRTGVLVLFSALVFAACTSSRAASTEPASTTTLASTGGSSKDSSVARDGSAARPPFVLVAGTAGLAVTDGATLTPLTPALATTVYGGVAVPLDGTRLAVMAGGKLGVTGADGHVTWTDCADCHGLVRSGDRILTAVPNDEAGGGFDIAAFSKDLTPLERVRARRLDERRTVDFPPEYLEVPAYLLLADDESVVATYLSVNGGVRGGPSVIARYSLDGTILQSAIVDGNAGAPLRSPDGQFLALISGGSSGACVHMADVVVLRYPALERISTGDSLAPELSAGKPALRKPWFDASNLRWRGTTIEVIGTVNQPGSDGCDPAPTTWSHEFDVDAARSSYRPAEPSPGVWIGPTCSDRLEVRLVDSKQMLFALSATGERQLGRYGTIGPMTNPPDEC